MPSIEVPRREPTVFARSTRSAYAGSLPARLGPTTHSMECAGQSQEFLSFFLDGRAGAGQLNVQCGSMPLAKPT